MTLLILFGNRGPPGSYLARKFCGLAMCKALFRDFRSGVGDLRPPGRIWPAKQHHPARSPFTNCINCSTRVVGK